jgi:hypothetical protein
MTLLVCLFVLNHLEGRNNIALDGTISREVLIIRCFGQEDVGIHPPCMARR